jgi:hypothetical protein
LPEASTTVTITHAAAVAGGEDCCGWVGAVTAGAAGGGTGADGCGDGSFFSSLVAFVSAGFFSGSTAAFFSSAGFDSAGFEAVS